MKRICIVTAAMMVTLCANAQFTEIDGKFGVQYDDATPIPQSITFNHKQYVKVSNAEVNRTDVYLYDQSLQLCRTIVLHLPTVLSGHYEEYRKEIGKDEDYNPVYGPWQSSDNRTETAVWPIYCQYIDWDAAQDKSLASSTLSQTLFNNDSKWEYIVPIVEATSSYSESTDYHGQIVSKRTDYSYKTVGLKVVNEDGEDLFSLPCNSDELLYECYIAVVKFNNKFYLNINSTTYLIDPITTSVKKMENLKLNIHPTIAERSSMITIELEDDGEAREFVVTGMDGRIVEQRQIPAGEKQIQVPAARMSSGLYNFTIRKRKAVQQNGKVIVR